MTWSHPIVLWGLLGPALGAATLIVLSFLRRRRSWTQWPGITRIIAIGTRVHPVGVAHGTRRPWLLLTALVFALLALAGPRWGSVDEPVYQKSREVMLALDLSRSMLVQDVPPARLERSRLLVRTLLDSLRGERVGLIVFAGTAFVQVPMSADYQILEEFLPELKPETMPQGGTDYDGMLRSALGGFSEIANTDRYLIVLSDGESTTEGWRDRIAELKERGIHVISLGVGTTAGGFIPDSATGAFVKDARGAVVLSRLESGTLQALATDTGGTYRDASNWVDLPAVLAETIERGRQGDFTEQRNSRAIERFQWFLAPALLLALLGVWREIPARPRTRQIRRTTAGGTSSPGATASVAGMTLIAFLTLTTPPARAVISDTTPESAAEKLGATVARLAASDDVAPVGWKTMAEQTLALAEEWKQTKQPPEPGVVRDALDAVDRGEALDASAADWPKLREDLSRLLEPPPEEEQKQDDEQKQDQEEKNDEEQQQPQDDQQQEGDKGEPKDEPQDQEQQEQKQEGSEGEEDSKEKKQKQQSAQQKQDSALGDLQKEQQEQQQQQQQPSPEASDEQPPKTQKFGGQQTQEQQDATNNPELAAALARLRQVSENDSPAQLHQFIEEEAQRQNKRPAPANASDW